MNKEEFHTLVKVAAALSVLPTDLLKSLSVSGISYSQVFTQYAISSLQKDPGHQLKVSREDLTRTLPNFFRDNPEGARELAVVVLQERVKLALVSKQIQP